VGALLTTKASAEVKILTNHLGYYPSGSKNIVIRSNEIIPTNFYLIDSKTNESIFKVISFVKVKFMSGEIGSFGRQISVKLQDQVSIR
jgi:hypothetical protein